MGKSHKLLDGTRLLTVWQKVEHLVPIVGYKNGKKERVCLKTLPKQKTYSKVITDRLTDWWTYVVVLA